MSSFPTSSSSGYTARRVINLDFREKSRIPFQGITGQERNLDVIGSCPTGGFIGSQKPKGLITDSPQMFTKHPISSACQTRDIGRHRPKTQELRSQVCHEV